MRSLVRPCKKNGRFIFSRHTAWSQMVQLSDLCDLDRHVVARNASRALIQSVVRLRSVKSDEENGSD